MFAGLARDLGLTSEAALSELPLIHDDKVNDQFPTWRRFFEATQSAMRDVTCGLRFNQSSLAIDAAIQGHGLLLGPQPPDRRRARRSSIDEPSPIGRTRFHGRYYTVRQRGEESRAVRTFLDWLGAEVEARTMLSRREPASGRLAPCLARRAWASSSDQIERDGLADVDRRGEEEPVGDQAPPRPDRPSPPQKRAPSGRGTRHW